MMRRTPVLTALLAFGLAGPALAQSAATENAVNAAQGPVTDSLNRGVQDNIDQTKMRNAVNQGQYEADKLAYRNAVIDHHIAVAHDEARYARQQGAYADAMAAWRMQVEACKHGYHKECDRPTPNPADFY